MNQLDVVVTIFGYLATIFCIKKSSGKLKIQAKAYLYHLLSRLLAGGTILLVVRLPILTPSFSLFINFMLTWLLAILGTISLLVYLKTKEVLYKYYFVFTLLFYLFGRSPHLSWIILAYLLLSLYNQKNKGKT